MLSKAQNDAKDYLETVE